ncbi:IclR family transcriptional regulator [Halomicrococcus sp. SG-WS-1]|uniref:IclR family transcriptional regulator n=1 Tax=Halomicrococcus sp. SG-WS-1 TaxID=3439057 RepID=UPI003F7B0427
MANEQTGIQTTETAFDIIEQLKVKDGAGITELATDLELAKSTVHKHLTSLRKRGYVRKNGETYEIALRFLDLGIYTRDREPVYQVAKPKVDEIAEQTGEKAWLITEEYGRGIHLYGAVGEHSVKTYARIGQLTYLHQHAAGKAILAHLPDSRIHEILDEHGLPAQTQHTISTHEQLFDEIEQIRDHGYATNVEESVIGLNAIGAPITDEQENVLAAISVSGPANRIQGNRLQEQLPELLLGAANEIEINLQYS